MSKLRLEGNLGVKAVRKQIATFETLSDRQISDIQLDIAPKAFLETGGIAQLASWLLSKKEKGAFLSLTGDDNVIGYLARMNFHKILGLPEPSITRNPEGGRFIPIIPVSDGEDTFQAVNAIADIVMQQFESVNEFLPAFEWAVNEIVDNIFNHSGSLSPGVVCGQLFPKLRRLDIAICDSGIGIRNSLSENYELNDHVTAIEKALQKGVTRNTLKGQGNGMAGTQSIMRLNGGKLLVWSGDALYRMENGEEKGFEVGNKIPGTGVLMSFDLALPVQLIDTFIGERTSVYIEYEADRISEHGINIAEACSHSASRPPAERLRRKILTLLPEVEGAISLNFSDVRVLSSSFLDELLGKLNGELGNGVFNKKIIVEGLSEVHQNMANNVIGQRLALTSTIATQENAWLVINNNELTLSKKYQIHLNGGPELFMSIKDGHWVFVGDGNGNTLFAAKILRVRSGETETILYLEKSTVLSAKN